MERLEAALVRRSGRSQDLALVLEHLVGDVDLAALNDPVGFVGVLRGCLDELRFKATDVRPRSGAAGTPDLLFQTLVAQLSAGVFPIPPAVALRAALAADGLLARREPFDRPDWAGDVGLHAGAASSFGRKGRLLSAVVRIMRGQRVIELGTAYGMSSLFLSAALGEQGTVATVERSHPQLDVAKALLSDAGAANVTVIDGISSAVAEQVAAHLPAADLLFHDAEHSARAYVEDFAAFEPLLAPGAVVIYDDISWSNPRGATVDPPYQGWLELTRGARVRQAVELDGEFGLLLLD